MRRRQFIGLMPGDVEEWAGAIKIAHIAAN
jgi:hypothetical protein